MFWRDARQAGQFCELPREERLACRVHITGALFYAQQTCRLAASGSCLCSPDECLTHRKGQPRPAVEHESGGGERQRAAHPPHHPACEAACMPAVVISWAGSREA